MTRFYFRLLSLASLIAMTSAGLAQDDAIPPRPADQLLKLEVPDTLVIGTREVPPFSMRNEDNHWEGISIDLLRDVKAELEARSGHPVDLEFQVLPLEELLNAVENSQVDLAAAALTMNYEREKRMDFTHSFYASGLGIAIGAKHRRSGWSGIVDAFLSLAFLRIVAGLILAMFISAVGIYLFERRYNREHFGHGWLNGIASGMWWAAVTITTVGYGDKVPTSLGGRLIGLVWMFAGLFIIAGFTAAVTSALTLTELQARISGPSELPRVKVATVEGSTSADYLRARHIMYVKHPDVESALASLVADQCDAVVYDEPILKYQVFQNYAGEAFVLPLTFERQNYAFALPSGSPLRETVNQVLLRRTSSPSWDEVLASYFGESQ
ncbi:transporter substrate-binding domain-containing protein [Blastopirellula sp. J2-11]|uniref:transporter substrate-binding domain-containing protein n=1 Tax=Blastopirellula sp. J2-11 TaxID=2943192 RepID=UPI0021C9B518|nr:transporter substrate-binding domain-containing protein [Blastopirellula sp. J2-11]UUO08736.1 transporter substrate-binding domain-containing protein [Blastopirellula sp. J2-11]